MYVTADSMYMYVLIKKEKESHRYLYALKMISCIDVVRIIGSSEKTETKFSSSNNWEFTVI